MKTKCILAAVLALALLPATADAQQRLVRKSANKEYVTPFPGFKIAGNFYYVGTEDLGCYLIDTGAGLILINTGVPGSYALIKANMTALGFKTTDIKIFTATHAHWDHVADLAAFKKDAPGMKVYISERDAPAVEHGGNPDFLGAYRIPFVPQEFRNNPGAAHGMQWDPVKVDVKMKPGDHIKLGNADLTVLKAYGHTPGAVSFNFPVKDGGKTYNVYLVNTNTINPGIKLLETPGYPGIVEDFRGTLAEQAKYKPDIWVSTHAYQFNMHDLYKPGDRYKPSRFGDLALYRAKIADETARFERALALERARLAEERARH